MLNVIETPYYWVTPAVPPPYHTEWHRVQREIREEAERSANRAIEQTEQIIAKTGAKMDSMVLEGHPSEEIIRIAEDIEADLVVVGSKGLTGAKLFLLGSVSQNVVKYAPCSVLLTRPTKEHRSPRVTRVIWATDGSENATSAGRFLSEFLLGEDAKVIILHVLQQGPRWAARSEPAQHAFEQFQRLRSADAESVVETAKSSITTAARVTTVVRGGDPTEQILELSTELEADLVVMGSKGLSGIKLFLLGSVSQEGLPILGSICHASKTTSFIWFREGIGDLPWWRGYVFSQYGVWST